MVSINELWTLACSGNTEELLKENVITLNQKYSALGKKHSLVMGAYRNGKTDTAVALIREGVSITQEELEELLTK